MKSIIISLILICLTLFVVSCKSHRGTLYIDKQPTQMSIAGIGVSMSGIASPKFYEKAMRYLERESSAPIYLIGKDCSVNSYKDYAVKMNIPLPNSMSTFNVTLGMVKVGMDTKDIWLSKGAPLAIFYTDEFITWRYKDDSLVSFVDNKVVIH